MHKYNNGDESSVVYECILYKCLCVCAVQVTKHPQ